MGQGRSGDQQEDERGGLASSDGDRCAIWMKSTVFRISWAKNLAPLEGVVEGAGAVPAEVDGDIEVAERLQVLGGFGAMR